MGIVYFKDRFAEEGDCRISLHDRAFRFGDGLFETVLVAGGRAYDLAGHIERLEKGLAYTRIALPEVARLPELCREVIRRNALDSGLLRIIISRGEDEGGGSYKIAGSTPYMIIWAAAKPYPAFTPVTLWCASVPASLRSPAKTHSALHYVLALQEAADNGCANALLTDKDGHLCETASGNIFWVRGGVLFTPSTQLPMVPGTMRARVLELWEGACEEGHFTADDLKNADEIFMTNTGVIVAPVVSVQPLAITKPPGVHTRALRQRLDGAIRGNNPLDIHQDNI